MVIPAIAATAVLTVVFLIKKRQLKAKGGRRFVFHFFDKSLEFLIPFTVIGLLFILLSLYVGSASDKTTIGQLMLLEKLIGFFKLFVSFFKVGAWATLLLLIIFYVLSLTRIPSQYTSKLLPYFQKYQKAVKWVYLIVIILFSFTFFGTQAGEPEARLRFRVNEAQGKYGELRQAIKEALSQEAEKKLVEKLKNSAEENYRKDLDAQNQFHVYFIRLNSEYQVFKTKYQRRDEAAENVISHPPPDDPPPPEAGAGDGIGGGDKPNTGGSGTSSTGLRSEPASSEKVVYEIFDEGEPIVSTVEPSSLAGSTETMIEAKTAVRNFQDSFNSGAVDVLKSDQGKEIILLLPRSSTGKLKEAVIKVLTDRYPILEPIIGALVGVVNKELETRISAAADRLAEFLAQNPMNVSKALQEEASRIADETKISYSDVLLRKARATGDSLRTRGQRLRDVLSNLNARGRQLDEIATAVAEFERQIELLRCRNEQRRLNAVSQLAKASPYLKSDQVERIEAVLEDNTERLRASKAYRGSYEVVPERYYAALALREMRSSFISVGVREAAVETIRAVDSVPLSSRTTYPSEFVNSLGLAAP
jgi:hypothetical protein